MSRWLQALLIGILGLIVGLFYGWRIAPVEYINTTPDTLDQTYKNEYTLMVAEAYQSHGDLELAARQLGLLGSTEPAEIIQTCLDNATYSETELQRIQQLLDDIQRWQPTLGESAP
jgi:hypothetical protein